MSQIHFIVLVAQLLMKHGESSIHIVHSVMEFIEILRFINERRKH